MLVAGATALAFGRVFEGRLATLQLLSVGVLSGVLAWALERRGLLVATVASAGALLVVLGLLTFRETTWFGLPTLETLRQMGGAAAAVSEQARIQTAPAPPIDPLMLAGIVAMWASVFSCHALAFRAGSPLLALVPPVALLAFADTVLEELIRPMYGVTFLIGALAIAFADNVRRTQAWGPVWSGRAARRAGLVGASGRGARRLAVAALAVAAVSPIAMPGFGSSGLIDVSSITDGDRVLIDPLVSVASELNRDDPVDVLMVSTETPSYLRMLTLPDFDGITWRRADEPQGTMVSETLQASSGAEPFGQAITVTTDLGFPWIPMAAEPTWVDLDGELTWDPDHATITAADPLDADTSYSTRSDAVHPSPGSLEGIEASLPEGHDRFVALPSDLPVAIHDMALQWTEGLTSDYEKVLAIQDQLRAFAYNPDVEWRDDSSTLVEFLYVTRAGFCQQFASAMAVMLRTLDIPARVAVGFTEGIEDPSLPDTYRISTDNLHTWVEVPFGIHGWLAFEPTPGRTNPVARTYQQPETADLCRGEDCPVDPGRPIPRGGTAVPEQPPRQVRDVPPDAGAGAGADEGPSIRRILLWAGAALLALVAVGVPLGRWLLRRRRLRRAKGEPRRMVLATYDVLSQRAADLGAGRSAGETPGEYLRRLAASDRLEDGHLARLTQLAVLAAYSPNPIDAGDALDAEADARQVLKALRRTTPPIRRFTGAYRRG